MADVIRCPECKSSYPTQGIHHGGKFSCAQCGATILHREDAEQSEHAEPAESVEMPTSTIFPTIVAVGVTLLLGGLATSYLFSAVGVLLVAIGMVGWVALLLPGEGHYHEPAAEAPPRIVGERGTVEHLHEGMPGYRFRLPLEIHPISAGIKGGLVGGLVMPIPAFIYGLVSGHGLWYPVNLLSGMLLPGVNEMTVGELEQFSFGLLLLGIVIHFTVSIVFGLMFGVLLPTLPAIAGGKFLWGAVVLPLLWTGLAYGLMGAINPALEHKVNWYWFVVCQFVYGIAAAIVVLQSEKVPVPPAGSGPQADAQEST